MRRGISWMGRRRGFELLLLFFVSEGGKRILCLHDGFWLMFFMVRVD